MSFKPYLLRPTLFAGILTLFVAVSEAQILPQSAHVNLYLPQLVDGGPAEQQWKTTVTLSNPNASSSLALRLDFFDNNGSPLPLDFGTGPTSTVTVLIPAGGSRVLRSRVASNTTLVGWARGVSTSPVQATVEFRTIVNGVPKLAVNAESTLPSYRHRYAANAFTSIALGNVITNAPTSVDVRLFDSDGILTRTNTETLPAGGHSAFTLLDRFPNLSLDFDGTVELISPTLEADYVAWALRSDSTGVISSLPPGRYRAPGSSWDDIWMAFLTTFNVAHTLFPDVFDTIPTLQISTTRSTNAFAANGNTIQVNLALAELIADSPSELAFGVAHELGHIYQQRTGRLEFHSNVEKDADIWGFLLSLGALYDPYAGAGTLSKLAMATGSAGLTTQFENLLSGEAHGSFNERVANVYDAINLMCGLGTAKNLCGTVKSIMHPHFPSSVPLQDATPPIRQRPEVVVPPEPQ